MSDTARLETETLIGVGLTSEVFSWGDGKVLKLLFPFIPESTLNREFDTTRAIQSAGLPAPAAFEIVRLGERHGIVLERVRGESLLRRVERKPWTLFRAARQLAELHAHLHSHRAPPELPSQREQLEGWVDGAVDYSLAAKQDARRLLEQFPSSDCVCHGDFHPANILLTTGGPVVIDWSTGTRGHALTDVARTSVLFEQASLPPGSPWHIQLLMKFSRQMLHSTYLNRYLELRPSTMVEIEKWRVPQRMAASTWRAERRNALARAGIQG